MASASLRRCSIAIRLSNRFVYADCFDDGAKIASISSMRLPKGMLVEKFNKSDKEACAAVASVLADRLKELGYSSASLQPRVKYHGRKKAFVDALRQKGVKV